jgi:hypothetical protein
MSKLPLELVDLICSLLEPKFLIVNNILPELNARKIEKYWIKHSLEKKLIDIKKELEIYRANQTEIFNEYEKNGICEYGYIGHMGSFQNCYSCGKIFCYCEMGFEKINVLGHIIYMQLCNNCWNDKELVLESLRKKYNSFFVEKEHIQDIETMQKIQEHQLYLKSIGLPYIF